MTEYRLKQIYQLTDNTKDGWSGWKPLPESLCVSNEWGYTQMEFRPDPEPDPDGMTAAEYAAYCEEYDAEVYPHTYDIVRQEHNNYLARRGPLPPGAM